MNLSKTKKWIKEKFIFCKELLKKPKNVARLLFVLAVPFFQYTIIEMLNRQTEIETVSWVMNHMKLALLGSFILAVFMVFFMSLFRYRVGMIVSCVVALVLGIINCFKFLMRGDGFSIWDIFMVKETGTIVTMTSKSFYPFIVPAVIVTAGMIVLGLRLFKGVKFKKNKKVRLSMGAVSLLAMYLLFINPFTYSKVNAQYVSLSDNFQARGNYSYTQNGFIAEFYKHIKYLHKPEEPQGYSEATINKIIAENTDYQVENGSLVKSDSSKAEATPQASSSQASTENPNVIMIMSEAFWDTTQLPGITYDKDIFYMYNKLKAESSSGLLTVPAYGGGTANTEFEALTMLSASDLPQNVKPTRSMNAYKSYVKENLPSIAWELKDYGYDTVGVHPWEKAFYGRETVWPKLGLDKTVFLEDMPDAVNDGAWTSDQTFTDYLIKEIETPRNAPLFMYGTSVQAHWKYTYPKENNNPVTITSPVTLTPEARGYIEDHAHHMYEANVELERLLKAINDSGKPTILVFFGDHKPSLGSDYLGYKETGYVQTEEDIEVGGKMNQTEYLIWNNMGIPNEQLDLHSYDLGNKVMQMMGKERTIYGDVVNSLLNNKNEKTSEEYEMIKYDLIYGKQYILKHDNKYNEMTANQKK